MDSFKVFLKSFSLLFLLPPLVSERVTMTGHIFILSRNLVMLLGKNTVALIVIINDTPILKTFLPETDIKSC